jgi:hypothetical protein
MLILGGAVAGLILGYVLQRSQQCFHATFAGLYERRTGLFRAWLLAVAVGAVGLAVVYGADWWPQLNDGLSFRPVHNIVGGLLIGAGMAVAMSCVSGLYFKLGAGMLGALVGLAGWALGELLARDVELPGNSTVLTGDEGTIPDVLGVPRLAVALPLLAAVAWYLWRSRDGVAAPTRAWQWTWPVAGVALGGALILTWITAGMAESDFGASTVGAASSVADGDPKEWLLAFLVGLVPGAFLAARTAGGLWVRGETGVRYGQLAVGGALLGAGGIIGGGCNLGHGLSGVAQLNVSSWVVVASIVAGIGITRAVRARLLSAPSPVPAELGGQDR